MAEGGKDEVRLGFIAQADKDESQAPQPGKQHNVTVQLGDTIHDFKMKLIKACTEESKALSERTQANLSDDERNRLSNRYTSASKKLSVNHVVMVFVPSEQLHKFTTDPNFKPDNPQYRQLYKKEEQDPRNWQPLDPIRTFFHYQKLYGFGAARPQKLRIVEGTASYRLRNPRYKKFMEDQKRLLQVLPDMNGTDKCFGYARHKHDDTSNEWRPVIVERSGGDRSYTVDWVYCPVLDSRGEPTKQEVDQAEVLLAPLAPSILSSGDLERERILEANIAVLREKDMSEAALAKELTKVIKDKWESSKAEDDGGKPAARPPDVSQQEVKYLLRKLEFEMPADADEQ